MPAEYTAQRKLMRIIKTAEDEEEEERKKKHGFPWLGAGLGLAGAGTLAYLLSQKSQKPTAPLVSPEFTAPARGDVAVEPNNAAGSGVPVISTAMPVPGHVPNRIKLETAGGSSGYLTPELVKTSSPGRIKLETAGGSSGYLTPELVKTSSYTPRYPLSKEQFIEKVATSMWLKQAAKHAEKKAHVTNLTKVAVMMLVKQMQKQSDEGGPYDGVRQLGLQSNLPVQRKRKLSPQEEEEIAEAESKLVPKIFKGYGDPATADMSSPWIGAVGGGVAGALGGGLLGGLLPRDKDDKTNGLIAPALLAGAGGIAGALGMYYTRKAKNEGLRDIMARLPQGATRRDLRSDSVYSGDLAAAQAQRSNNAQMLMLAGLMRR